MVSLEELKQQRNKLMQQDRDNQERKKLSKEIFWMKHKKLGLARELGSRAAHNVGYYAKKGAIGIAKAQNAPRRKQKKIGLFGY